MNAQKTPSKKVFNSFSVRSSQASPCGCRIRETFILRLNDHYFKEPYKTGEFDQYEYIQSFKADCDMRVLITRYLNGDPALADMPWPVSSDVGSGVDLRSVLDAQIRLKNAYDTLSDADRAKYSFNDLVALLGNVDNLSAFISKGAEENAKKSEVVTDES